MKAQIAYFGLFLLVVGLVVAPALPAYAADEADPDSVDVPLIYVFRHVLYENDTLFLAYYNINYGGTYPNASIDYTYIFRLLDTDDSELGLQYAYPYADLGYNQGVVSMYFTNTSDINWGTLYTFQIVQSPVYFPADPDTWDFPLTASAYQNGTTQAEQQDALETRVLEMSYSLGLAWDTTMVDPQDYGNFLSSVGELYWRNVVYGLQWMAPGVFYLQELAANWTLRTWNVSQADVLAGLYNNTWVYNATAAGASLFGWSHQMLLALPLIAILAVVFWISAKRYSDTDPAFMSALIIAAGAVVMGFVGIVLEAMIGFVMVAWLGYFWFFQRS